MTTDVTRAVWTLKHLLQDYRHAADNDLEWFWVDQVEDRIEALESAMSLPARVQSADPAQVTGSATQSSLSSSSERDRLIAERDALRVVVDHAEQMVPEALDVLRRENFVFRRFPRDMKAHPPVGEEERWEALAFSLYSRIGEVSSMAVRALNEVDDLSAPDEGTASDARFTPSETGTADGSAPDPSSSLSTLTALQGALSEMVTTWRAMAKSGQEDILPGDECAIARWTMAEMLADELSAALAVVRVPQRQEETEK